MRALVSAKRLSLPDLPTTGTCQQGSYRASRSMPALPFLRLLFRLRYFEVPWNILAQSVVRPWRTVFPSADIAERLRFAW